MEDIQNQDQLLRKMNETLAQHQDTKLSLQREKEGNLTQTYDENPYTNRKFENQWTTQKRHQNLQL